MTGAHDNAAPARNVVPLRRAASREAIDLVVLRGYVHAESCLGLLFCNGERQAWLAGDQIVEYRKQPEGENSMASTVTIPRRVAAAAGLLAGNEARRARG